MEWSQTPLDSGSENASAFVISATLNSNEKSMIHHAVKQTIDKAVSILTTNINDASRYFLCEWDNANASLTVVVTDDSKTDDAKGSVKCQFVSSNQLDKHSAEFADDIRHWIHNYLTTHKGFMQYSLIAVFHNSSRKNTILL